MKINNLIGVLLVVMGLPLQAMLEEYKPLNNVYNFSQSAANLGNSLPVETIKSIQEKATETKKLITVIKKEKKETQNLNTDQGCVPCYCPDSSAICFWFGCWLGSQHTYDQDDCLTVMNHNLDCTQDCTCAECSALRSTVCDGSDCDGDCTIS